MVARRKSANSDTPKLDIDVRPRNPEEVCFEYTNYRGVTATRRVIPITILFGSSQYHPHPQWLLRAMCMERGAVRDFALRDITNWRLPPI